VTFRYNDDLEWKGEGVCRQHATVTVDRHIRGLTIPAVFVDVDVFGVTDGQKSIYWHSAVCLNVL
jgi:hypothetical protein